jgi:hypothetical protein
MEGPFDDLQAAMADRYMLHDAWLGRLGRPSEPGYLSGLTDSPEAS